MNRIEAAFKNKPIFMPYFPLGYPDLDTSVDVIEALAKRLHGVKVRYSVGPFRVRETYVLPYDVTAALLLALRLQDKYDSIKKYATPWSIKSIQACRVDK